MNKFNSIFKYIIFVYIFSYSLNVNGQIDSLISYDVNSKSITIIPGVNYDSTVTFEQTSFSIGSLGNQSLLSLTVPINNVFSGSQFSDIERAALHFNISEYPIRTATKLLYYNKDTLGGGCSGILVGKDLVLTAGHCVGRFNNKKWNGDSILVIPDYDNGEHQLGMKATVVTKYYLFKSYYDGNIQKDYALLKLKEPIGEEIGWVGIGFHSDETFYTDNVFHKFSYPGIANLCDKSKVYNGDTMYYNYGKISPLSNRNELGVKNACGIPGQSGSSFLYTDNLNYYSVGIQIWMTSYNHYKITNNVFYQFKNIIDSQVSGIYENVESSKIQIFPIPTKGFLNIQTKEKFYIELKNALGQNLTFSIFENDNLYVLNLSGLDNGIYFLTLKNDKKSIVKRIVIEN